MRRRSLTALLLGPVLAGCGGLSNTPFMPATVQGLVSGVDPAFAVVAVRDAGLSTVPDSSGHFVLEGVLPGSASLFVVANEQAGVLLDVTIEGGQVNDLGTLTLQPTASITLELEAPSAQRLDLAVVKVNGVPARISPTSERGEALIGPLPEGCYELSVQVPGFQSLDETLCLARGEQREAHLRLPDPNGSTQLGCGATGCLPGYACQASTGRCREP
jgi:hypothetical protein